MNRNIPTLKLSTVSGKDVYHFESPEPAIAPAWSDMIQDVRTASSVGQHRVALTSLLLHVAKLRPEPLASVGNNLFETPQYEPDDVQSTFEYLGEDFLPRLVQVQACYGSMDITARYQTLQDENQLHGAYVEVEDIYHSDQANGVAAIPRMTSLETSAAELPKSLYRLSTFVVGFTVMSLESLAPEIDILTVLQASRS